MTDPTPPPPSPQQPNPYQSAPYGTTPYGAPLAPRTNTLAIVALVLGLTVPIGGIIAGHIALGQIKRTGEGGHGLALAGTILGYVFTAFLALYIIGIILAIVFSAGTGTLYS
jgi:Domain of unknown function (DUF4190)